MWLIAKSGCRHRVYGKVNPIIFTYLTVEVVCWALVPHCHCMVLFCAVLLSYIGVVTLLLWVRDLWPNPAARCAVRLLIVHALLLFSGQWIRRSISLCTVATVLSTCTDSGLSQATLSTGFCRGKQTRCRSRHLITAALLSELRSMTATTTSVLSSHVCWHVILCFLYLSSGIDWCEVDGVWDQSSKWLIQHHLL